MWDESVLPTGFLGLGDGAGCLAAVHLYLTAGFPFLAGRCFFLRLSVITAEELAPVSAFKIAPEIIILGYLDLWGTLCSMSLYLVF